MLTAAVMKLTCDLVTALREGTSRLLFDLRPMRADCCHLLLANCDAILSAQTHASTCYTYILQSNTTPLEHHVNLSPHVACRWTKRNL